MVIKKGTSRLALFACCIVLFASGCASSRVIDDAQKILDKAGEMHADYLAPYHYTSAEAYLNEARDQQAHSDFEAARSFAQKALEKAQKAYEIAMSKQSVSPAVTAKTIEIESITLSTKPKQVTKDNIDRARAKLSEMEQAGVKQCAPKEFALAEAYLDFCEEEWGERDYNKAANLLKKVRSLMEQSMRFMKNCQPNQPPNQTDKPKGL